MIQAFAALSATAARCGAVLVLAAALLAASAAQAVPDPCADSAAMTGCCCEDGQHRCAEAGAAGCTLRCPCAAISAPGLPAAAGPAAAAAPAPFAATAAPAPPAHDTPPLTPPPIVRL